MTSPFPSNEMSMKYKEIISTLPKRDAPYPSSIDLYQYKGFWLPLPFLEATLSMHDNFKAQPFDIYLCGLPKTGTTWLKALVFSVMTRDRFDDSTNPLLTKVPHECIPTLEIDCAMDTTSLDAEFPLLATHLPYTCLPSSILESESKIIYLCREPKDTFVSMWHYRQRLKESISELRTNYPVTLEQEFKWYIEGKSAYGPYWDHVSEYLKASGDRPEKVFFLKYEDLKSDTLCFVKKLAEFMGKPFSEEEVKQGVAEKIVDNCHFKSLSNLEVNKNGCRNPKPWIKINNSTFFRKGEIGDWRNLLTEDMAKSIDYITKEKFQSFGLSFHVSKECENNTKDQ